MIVTDSLIGNIWEHLGIGGAGVLVGATAMRIFRDTIAYAVSTFPEPTTTMGRWRLGVLKKVFGEIAVATQNQQDTKSIAATGGGGN